MTFEEVPKRIFYTEDIGCVCMRAIHIKIFGKSSSRRSESAVCLGPVCVQNIFYEYSLYKQWNVPHLLSAPRRSRTQYESLEVRMARKKKITKQEEFEEVEELLNGPGTAE